MRFTFRLPRSRVVMHQPRTAQPVESFNGRGNRRTTRHPLSGVLSGVSCAVRQPGKGRSAATTQVDNRSAHSRAASLSRRCSARAAAVQCSRPGRCASLLRRMPAAYRARPDRPPYGPIDDGGHLQPLGGEDEAPLRGPHGGDPGGRDRLTEVQTGYGQKRRGPPGGREGLMWRSGIWLARQDSNREPPDPESSGVLAACFSS
jgi:hypothetical protein